MLTMRAFRSIFAVMLALLFVFSTNRCAIAAAFPAEVEECCQNEDTPAESQRGLPCSGKDCAPCATLESGVNPASLLPFVAPAPVWTGGDELAELLRRLVADLVVVVVADPPDPATIPAPPWVDGLMTVSPVRGPSLVA